MSRWRPDASEVHLGQSLDGGTAGLLADFEAQLAGRALRKSARLRCVIGGEAVRYAVVPWSDELSSPTQRQRLAEQTYFETYGDVARGWTVCHHGATYGAAALACAIETPLLDGLETVARAYGLALASVQPVLMHAFNQVRRSLARSLYWFVLVESRSVTLLLMSADEPLQVKRLPSPGAGLANLLDREWFALGVDGPRCPVFVVRCADAPAALTETPPARCDASVTPWSITALPLPPAAPVPMRQSVAA